jgi:hypothetical protein
MTEDRNAGQERPQIPQYVKNEAAKCAKDLMGSGYVDEYYRQIAQDFLWLYEVGFQDGRERTPPQPGEGKEQNAE